MYTVTVITEAGDPIDSDWSDQVVGVGARSLQVRRRSPLQPVFVSERLRPTTRPRQSKCPQLGLLSLRGT